MMRRVATKIVTTAIVKYCVTRFTVRKTSVGWSKFEVTPGGGGIMGVMAAITAQSLGGWKGECILGLYAQSQKA